jgi:hypothetical protein
MEKQLIFGVSILLICISFSGCFDNEQQESNNSELTRFVGTWIHNYAFGTETIICFSNGTCSWNNISGYYDIKDGKFVIDLPSLEIEENTYIFDYYFSDNDNTLILKMSVGTPIEYIKQ